MASKDDAQLDLGLPRDDADGALAAEAEALAEAPAPVPGRLGATQRGGPLQALVDSNFLQYASYVIRDRAIPDLADGLKPVQRRILWSLHEKDDGKFTKVANIVGHTMQYHPHGDASIEGALVTLANKEFVVEGQGNFGNLFTGDPAAASRYIECRLTELARGELFNDDLTRLVPSYDGRRKEPVALPAKIPLLLLIGAEGIAVGLSTRIFPHNFRELLEAQIAILRKQPFVLYPDFRQGGRMDASEYAKGNGRIRLRAVLERRDAETLVVREIPFATTTDSLIASIETAAKKGKIKVRTINDFTAEAIEIEIKLLPGQDLANVEQALYAFTQCEVTLTGRVIVLDDNRPVELDVERVLRANTEKLLDILRRELEWNRRRLQDELHRKSLVQIFVEERIYKHIETCRTAPAVSEAILTGFAPFADRLSREISGADIEMLLQIPIRRISLFDMEKNRREMDAIVKDLAEIEKKLQRLVPTAIRYLQGLLQAQEGKCPRRTQLAPFEQVEVRQITAEELTLRYDPAKGYLGTEVAEAEGVQTLRCSSYDRVLLAWADGRYKAIAPPDKLFVDGDLVYFAVAERDRPITLVYEDGLFTFLKRFTFGGTILNREYRCAPEGSKVLFFSAADPERLYVRYKPAARQRINQQVFQMKTVAVRGVKARGLQMTSKRIRSVSVDKPRNWGADTGQPGGVLLDV